MVKYGGIKYNAVRYVVVDEVDACLLHNAGSMSTNLQGTPLHSLLSRYLSPTFDVPQKDDDALSMLGAAPNDAPRRPLQQQRQTVFCSATIPQHNHFLQQCVQNQWTVREPVHVCASPGELLPPTLQHTYMVCLREEKKVAALRRLIRKLASTTKSESIDDENKVLIFCEPQRPMREMAQVLAHDLDGIYWKEGFGPEQEQQANAIVSVLRYEESLSQRAAAMQAFQGTTNIPKGRIIGQVDHDENDDHDERGDGEPVFDAATAMASTTTTTTTTTRSKFRVLLSTDLAARGLDVSDVTHVVQMDLPPDADTYVHRAGRTGRLGRRGTVVSIITSSQEFVLDRLSNKLSLDLMCVARQNNNKKRKKTKTPVATTTTTTTMTGETNEGLGQETTEDDEA